MSSISELRTQAKANIAALDAEFTQLTKAVASANERKNTIILEVNVLQGKIAAYNEIEPETKATAEVTPITDAPSANAEAEVDPDDAS